MLIGAISSEIQSFGAVSRERKPQRRNDGLEVRLAVSVVRARWFRTGGLRIALRIRVEIGRLIGMERENDPSHRTMKKRKKIIGIFAGATAATLLTVCLTAIIRTATYPFAKLAGPDGTPDPIRPSDRAVERLAGGIRIPTVSQAVDARENNPFDAFKAYLPAAYPEVYKHLDSMTVNRYGLLLHWRGRDPSLRPILFCSHYDVVPVMNYDPATPDAPLPGWDYPPFSGAVADGRIYGRGTLDMKGMLFSILEAADALLEKGFRPERDVWIAFGFDEEIGGTEGALHIARYFKQQHIVFDAVYDEGGIIAAPGLAGIRRSVALVGTAEKGFSTLRITVYGQGGHSSMPPARGSLVDAAEIIVRLNERQLPAHLTAPVATFLDRIGGSMGFVQRMAIANRWLLESRLLRSFEKQPATAALVRTTTAVTMARGSDAPNVLASEAEVTVNFRLLPGNTTGQVREHVEAVCEGYRTRIEELSAREPSHISPDDVHGFEMIRNTVAGLYPGTVVTPYLTLGGTDAYKYESVSPNVFRFMPVLLTDRERETIHNENESISLENYGRMIAYFRNLIENYR